MESTAMVGKTGRGATGIEGADLRDWKLKIWNADAKEVGQRMPAEKTFAPQIE
jgi:hypothetical protein